MFCVNYTMTHGFMNIMSSLDNVMQVGKECAG